MGLSVLDGVVSSVLSSSVVSCGLHVASYSLIRRVSCLLDQLVRSSSECHQHIPKQSRRGWLVSVCSCTEMSVSTLCLGGRCVFSGISLRLVQTVRVGRIVDASFGLLSMCHSLVSQNGYEEKEKTGGWAQV